MKTQGSTVSRALRGRSPLRRLLRGPLRLLLVCLLLTGFVSVLPAAAAGSDPFEYTFRQERSEYYDFTWVYIRFDSLSMPDFPLNRNDKNGGLIGSGSLPKGLSSLTLHFDSDGHPFVHINAYYYPSSVPMNVPTAINEALLTPASGYSSMEDWDFDYSYDREGRTLSQGQYTLTIPAGTAWIRIVFHGYFGSYNGLYCTDLVLFVKLGDTQSGIVQNETDPASPNPGEDGGKDIDPGIVDPTQPAKTPGGSSGSGKTPGGSTPGGYFPGGYTPGGNYGSTSTGGRIALSIGGALAAAGAIGAAAGSSAGSSPGSAPDEKKKRYKMYVYKAFGDVLQKGAQPVKVYARVSQILDGKEYDCPEQTARIQISGADLIVQPAGIDGHYMSAWVSAPADSAAAQGAVIFTLAGPGGVYRRSIVFRLVTEPQIAFPRLLDNGRWDTSVREDTVAMIAGEGGRERLRFVIVDAMEEPKVIQFRDTDGFIIDAKPDPKLAFTYYALIDNKTDRMEKAGGIFADKEDRRITVEAIFKDGLRISGCFNVELYPDGLSVIPEKDHVKNDRLVIDTTEEAEAGAGFARIRPVYFDVLVCYPDDTTGRAVIRKNPSLRHEDPDDGGRYGLLFKENFSYRIRHMGAAGIAFFPLNTLPFLGDPYEASMRLIYDGDRIHFEEDLPLDVLGEKPAQPSSAEMERAIAWLKKDIVYFGIGSDPQLKDFLQHAWEHSASEIEFVRKSVIEAGTVFYKEEGAANQAFDQLLTKYIVVTGSLIKAMDFALEYTMKLQWGPYGSIAAKFVNPLKNLLGTYIGEYIANHNLDGAPNFIESVLKASEDALSSAITGVFFGDDDFTKGVNVSLMGKDFSHPPIADQLKDVLGYIIAAYLLTCFIRHYNYGKKGEAGDVYRSAVAACMDLGFESLKAWFLNFIQNQCKSLFKLIGEAAGKLYKTVCQKQIREMAAKAGSDAFSSSMRTALLYDQRGLTKASLDAVREAKDQAFDDVFKRQNGMLDNVTAALGTAGETVGDWLQDSPLVGSILNYMAGGTLKDEEALGLTAKEVILGWLTDRLGVKVDGVFPNGIYTEDRLMNPLDVSAGIENGKIILEILGHRAEIPVLENIAVLSELMFDTLLSWMNGLLKAAKPALDYRGMEDLRDRVQKDPDALRKDLEEMRQRCSGFEGPFSTGSGDGAFSDTVV